MQQSLEIIFFFWVGGGGGGPCQQPISILESSLGIIKYKQNVSLESIIQATHAVLTRL